MNKVAESMWLITTLSWLETC